MAETSYFYTISVDFTSGSVDLDNLTTEIEAGLPAETLLYISSFNDTCEIRFQDAIASVPALDAIIGSHGGQPVDDTVSDTEIVLDALTNITASGDLSSSYPDPSVVALTDSEKVRFPIGDLTAGETMVVAANGDITSVAEMDLPIVVVRRGSTYTPGGTFADINFDTIDLENAPDVVERDDSNQDRLLINESGSYLLGFVGYGTAFSSQTATFRIRVNDSDIIDGSTIQFGNYIGGPIDPSPKSIAWSKPVDLPTGFISLQGEGSGAPVFASLFFYAVRLRGRKGVDGNDGADGPQGPPGSGTSINVNNSGSVVSGSPFETLNLVYGLSGSEGVGSAIDIGSIFDGITVYDSSGGQTFTGTITVNLDATLTNTNTDLFTLAGNVVTVNFDGRILLTYNTSIANNSNNRSQSKSFLERNQGAGFSEIPGTRGKGYHRNNNQESTNVAATVFLEVASGDQFRIRADQESGGTLLTIANESQLTMLRVG